MSYDIDAAKEAGHSIDAQLNFLAKLHNYDIKAAETAGHSKQEQLQYLAGLPEPTSKADNYEQAPQDDGLGIPESAVGAALGASLGAVAGPAVGAVGDTAALVGSKMINPAAAGAVDMPGSNSPAAVRKWLATQTSNPEAGGRTMGEAFRKSEIAAGKPVQSRGSNVPIRKGNLGISNQLPETTMPQRAAANIINAEKLGKPGVARRMAGMGVAGAELGNMIEEAKQGHYGHAALSGLGALGGAASQSRIKPIRAIGTGIAAGVPLIQKFVTPDDEEDVQHKAAGGSTTEQEFGEARAYEPSYSEKIRDFAAKHIGRDRANRLFAGPNARPEDIYNPVSMALQTPGAIADAAKGFVEAGKEGDYLGGMGNYLMGAANVAPMMKPAGQVAKTAMRELGPKAAGMAEDYLSKIGGIQYAVPKSSAKMSPGMDLGKVLGGAEQTVDNPLRNAYPGVYKRPDVIAQEAAAKVAPEDPMLKQLFGVTRDDLYEMSKRQGNVPGFIPGASVNPKGSAAAESVMTPRNEQRLLDVLSEVKNKAPELYTGMHGWYTMDPQYHRMVELMGEEKAKQMYHRLNTFGGIESPNLPVPVEFNRASAANWLAEQGRMPDWIKYGGLPDKANVAGMPQDMIGVPGRVGHQRASTSQQKFMDTGEHGMISPKAPPYIQASSVPELGFQTDLPVGDAHWSRFLGLPDVRTSKEVSASVSTPELQQLAPWFKEKIAGASGLESVPVQAILWGAGSPQTGVKTAIGAGKLELQAIEIAKAAKRMGVSPETARDLILMGKARAGKKAGGLV
jgi:hypothetical protein